MLCHWTCCGWRSLCTPCGTRFWMAMLRLCNSRLWQSACSLYGTHICKPMHCLLTVMGGGLYERLVLLVHGWTCINIFRIMYIGLSVYFVLLVYIGPWVAIVFFHEWLSVPTHCETRERIPGHSICTCHVWGVYVYLVYVVYFFASIAVVPVVIGCLIVQMVQLVFCCPCISIVNVMGGCLFLQLVHIVYGWTCRAIVPVMVGGLYVRLVQLVYGCPFTSLVPIIVAACLYN